MMLQYEYKFCPNKECINDIEYEQEICDKCGTEIIWLNIKSRDYKTPCIKSIELPCIKCGHYGKNKWNNNKNCYKGDKWIRLFMVNDIFNCKKSIKINDITRYSNSPFK